jgi:phosphoribosyl-ATP pyrophosphohydrolase
VSAAAPPDGRVIDRLHASVEARRTADPDLSYTARLFAQGRAQIARKVGEEAVETVIEGLGGDRQRLAAESADLIYHLVVLWADAGLAPDTVWRVLAGRMGTGGLDEKRSRAPAP